jgi:hypothetical protein
MEKKKQEKELYNAAFAERIRRQLGIKTE